MCWRRTDPTDCVPSSASVENEINPSVFTGNIELSLKAFLMVPVCCTLVDAAGIHGSEIQDLAFQLSNSY